MTTRHVLHGTLLLSLLILTQAVSADPPAGYYDSVDYTNPSTVRQTVHDVIDGHTKIPYTSSSTDTWNVLELADEDPWNAGRILDVYQNRTFTKFGGGNGPYNREHVWPKSYGFADDGSSNLPYSDCHHLFLCDVGYNGDRANRLFDDCISGCSARVADSYGGESGTNYFKDASPVGIWETWIGRRGDVARAMFYMDVRYAGDTGSEPDLILTNNTTLIANSSSTSNLSVAYMGLLDVLLQWHEDDPVDDKERDRNDAVYTYQHNRNPFIDHPEFVDYIFLGVVADVPDAAAGGIAAVYPNPFNPTTVVSYDIRQPGPVQIGIFGVDGRLVRTLTSAWHDAGSYELPWDGRDEVGQRAASGAWFVRMISGDVEETRKVTLLK